MGARLFHFYLMTYHCSFQMSVDFLKTAKTNLTLSRYQAMEEVLHLAVFTTREQ